MNFLKIILRVIYPLVLYLLVGCSGNYVCPENPEPTIQHCKEAHHLPEGSSCLVNVFADQQENPSGLMVQEGEAYQIIAMPHQTWGDSKTEHHPLCGREGNTFINMFSSFKRVDKALWFSVIANVVNDSDALEGRYSQYDLCNTPKIEVSMPGQLIFYPNDANAMYWNNSGSVWLKIQRVKNQ
ncbi:MAG: hypothetical protein QX197_14945 [Methylococcaceae bacterium]